MLNNSIKLNMLIWICSQCLNMDFMPQNFALAPTLDWIRNVWIWYWVFRFDMKLFDLDFLHKNSSDKYIKGLTNCVLTIIRRILKQVLKKLLDNCSIQFQYKYGPSFITFQEKKCQRFFLCFYALSRSQSHKQPITYRLFLKPFFFIQRRAIVSLVPITIVMW